MHSQSKVSAEPDVLSALAGARFALVGFEAEESSSLSSFLSSFGSLTQTIAPRSDALTDAPFSAILLNLTLTATDSSCISLAQLLALNVPVIAIGSWADIHSFPAMQMNASELLFRPFMNEELLIQIGRSFSRTAQARYNSPARKLRILIADDDPSIVGLVSRVLQGRGYECHEATNGRRALELARTLLPDLLILDIKMPFVHGLDALTALRRDPSTAAMRILLFTAANGAEAVKLGGELGADGYLCKPFRPYEFVKRVTMLLPGSDSATQMTVAASYTSM